MILTINRADKAALADFPDIIDVRSPREFAEDHVPRSINLPVLNDAERAEVGSIYVQGSRFEARKIGAATVARNISFHLQNGLRDKAPGFAPLIYCWRGGQRSAAMATVLEQVGWRPTLLSGGYRTYRRAVNEALSSIQNKARIILLGGHTGTAKTAVLAEVKSRGIQVIDLENLAHHRGSLLGGFVEKAQPSQKSFESKLAIELSRLDLAQPILIEAESSKIGNINIPESLWSAMCRAPMVELNAPPEARAAYLTSAYRDLTDDLGRLESALGRLPGNHERDARSTWLKLARHGDFKALALRLMKTHYDPAFDRWKRNHPHPSLAEIYLEDFTAESIANTATQIALLLQQRATW